MLTPAELEMNVLEFRQRAFQYERTTSAAGAECAVFVRTETESESRFRPKLVRLIVVVPIAWVVHDEPSDTLRLAQDGTTPTPALAEPVVEVSAEPTEFAEQGIRWKRAEAPGGALVYAPLEHAERILSAAGLAALVSA